MVALINQQQGYTQGQGQINPTLYTLAGKSATYNTAFHDIVSGNNDCLAGTGFCSGKIGSSAMPGYDTASGLGSVDVFNLINAWPANTGTVLIATTTNVSASTTAPAIGASVSFTVTVAATDGSIPTGTVSISVDGGTAISGNALSSNGTFVYTTTFTTAGSHSILASYSGDTTHATSAGTATVNVPGPTSGTGSFGLAATNITVSQGSTGTSTITVTPAGGYKGTVAFNLTTSSSALTNACYTVGNATVTGTAAATTTLSFDTNATDCLSAAVRKAKHLQRFTGTGVASNNNPPLSSGKTTSAAAIFAGLILAGFLGRYSKKLRVLAGLVLLVTFGMAFSGCGGSSSSTNNDPPKGNYTVTLTGQDTSVATIPQATTTFTVTIN